MNFPSLTITAAVLLLNIGASAQSIYNPNILPLGDKEAMMGNAGTGGFGSTGAVYYNPGALSDVEGTSLSLSGSAYLQFKFSAKPIATILGTELEYEASGFQTIPTSVIIVKKVKEWHLAFSALVPMSFNYEGRQTWDIPNEGDPIKIKFSQNYKEENFLVGISAARKINDSWSAGVTVFAQNYTYFSSLDFRTELENNPDVIIQDSHREKFSPVSALVVLGLQKKFNKFNLGLRATLPSIHIMGEAEYYDYQYSNLDPNNVETSQIDVSGEKVAFRSPSDLRVGATYFPTEKWTATLDLSYQFSIDYDIFDDPEIDEEVNSKGNYRINAGVQYMLSDKFGLNGGFAYTPSTLQETDEEFGQDFTSVFLGGKSISKYFETTIGLFYSNGTGSGYSEIAGGTTTETYEYIGVVLGTNYRF